MVKNQIIALFDAHAELRAKMEAQHRKQLIDFLGIQEKAGLLTTH